MVEKTAQGIKKKGNNYENEKNKQMKLKKNSMLLQKGHLQFLPATVEKPRGEK